LCSSSHTGERKTVKLFPEWDPDNVISTEKTTGSNQFDPLFKIILDMSKNMVFELLVSFGIQMVKY
jgi:hypothetical protein